jgi:glycosyltransferase involved in cell wall biosynthesis
MTMVHTIEEYRERLQATKHLGQSRHCTIDGQDVSSRSDKPLVTIITVAFNSAATIERTILSVVAQTYRPIEYIVIDGGSSDGTVPIIFKWAQYISYWHSAKDSGISDAFNLGVAAAHGEFIGIVNSDDWMSADQIELLISALERTGAAFAFGRLAYHAADGSVLYYMDGNSDYFREIFWRMPPINHPTVIARRTMFSAVGLFDPHRRVAMDYDWHLRAELKGLRGVYVAAAIGHMMDGGISKNAWQKGLREVRDIAVHHTRLRFMPNFFYILRLTRGFLRLGITRLAPLWVVNAIHRKINPLFMPVQPKSK